MSILVVFHKSLSIIFTYFYLSIVLSIKFTYLLYYPSIILSFAYFHWLLGLSEENNVLCQEISGLPSEFSVWFHFEQQICASNGNDHLKLVIHIKR